MRGHKYHAIPTSVDGIRFDSRKEARRYQDLKLLVRAGEISDLELQPRFILSSVSHAGGSERIATYVADFQYLDTTNGEVVVEDVKGMLTPMYRMKKRWVQAQYGITIREA